MADEISSVVIQLLVISWVTTSLRCGVRTFIVRSFGLDDWLMLLSQVLYTSWGACLLLGTRAGLGKHMDTLTDAQIMLAMKYWYAIGGLYFLTTTAVKVAVGCFLLRVIAVPLHKNIIFGTLAVTVGYSIFMFFGTLFQCSPPSYFWDQDQDGSCSNKTGGVYTGYVHGGLSALVDFILAGIPFFMLRNSNLGWKKKVPIYIIMSLGSYAAVTTLIRLRTLTALTKTADYLYDITGFAIWSWVEPGVGIIAGDMATLRPLVRIVFEKTSLSKSATTNQRSTAARYDPDVNLDELRGERGVTTTNIEARRSPAPPLQPTTSARRSGESSPAGSDWQSFGSEEHLQASRIKKSVRVTVETSDATDIADAPRSPRLLSISK